jgi:putative oxidoreductase
MLKYMRMTGWAGKCWTWCHRRSVGLLILRVVLGAFFIAHGISKFENLAAMKEFFASLSLASPFAYVVAVVEILSGTALVLGAWLWPAALGITVIMAVAIWKVTGQNLYGQPFLIHFISGWAPNIIYAAAALSLAFTGAGGYSLSAWYMKRYRGEDACKECMVACEVPESKKDTAPAQSATSVQS